MYSQKRKSYDSHVISIIMSSFIDLVCLYTSVKCHIFPAYLSTLSVFTTFQFGRHVGASGIFLGLAF